MKENQTAYLESENARKAGAGAGGSQCKKNHKNTRYSGLKTPTGWGEIMKNGAHSTHLIFFYTHNNFHFKVNCHLF